MQEINTYQQKPTVVITGAAGFLGTHVCEHFVKDGGFTVRGTVRDIQNESKIESIKRALGDRFNEIALYKADLTDPDSIETAFAGADYIVHTAFPSHKDESELIKQAIESTQTVLIAAAKHKVKRVVLTSNAMAVYQPDELKEVYSSEDWSNPASQWSQPKAKTLAEKAAWDFMSKLPEGDRFELVVLNPGAMFGPSYLSTETCSEAIITQMLNGKLPGIPKIQLGIVDVRDVARAHLLAIKVPEAAGQRFLLSERTLWFRQIATVLNERIPDSKVNDAEMWDWLMKVGSWFSEDVIKIRPIWGKAFSLDTCSTTSVLGLKDLIPAEDSIAVMASKQYVEVI